MAEIPTLQARLIDVGFANLGALKVCREAADRIDALEAALRWIADQYVPADCGLINLTARAALEEQTDDDDG